MVNYINEEKKYIDKVGTYNVKISNIELKENEKGNKYFRFSVIDKNGAIGSIIVNCYNISTSAKEFDIATKIGYGTLLNILEAMGHIDLIEQCKLLEPMADDYNKLFEIIISNKIIGQINKEKSFGLEVYNKKPKEVINKETGMTELVVFTGQKFFPLEEREKGEFIDTVAEDVVPF